MSYHKQPSAGFAGLVAVIIVSFILLGCPTGSILDDLDGLLGGDDTTAPAVTAGYSALDPPAPGQFAFSWPEAQDDRTAVEDIVYRVVYSIDPADVNTAEATDNTYNELTGGNNMDRGRLDEIGTTQVEVSSPVGLQPSHTYYVNVLAVDEAGNYAQYGFDEMMTPGGADPEIVDDAQAPITDTHFEFSNFAVTAIQTQTFLIKNNGDAPLIVDSHSFSTQSNTNFDLSLDPEPPYEAIDPGTTSDLITLYVENTVPGASLINSSMTFTYIDADGVGTATVSVQGAYEIYALY